jgi:putative oxidoreductase
MRWDLAFRLILAGVFLWAGLLKLADPRAFAVDVRSFHLVSDPWVAWIALGLPWLEIFASLALMAAPWRLAGATALGGMLLIFLGGILSAWARGLDISCGCFGAMGTGKSNYAFLIARNLALLALCAAVARPRRER